MSVIRTKQVGNFAVDYHRIVTFTLDRRRTSFASAKALVDRYKDGSCVLSEGGEIKPADFSQEMERYTPSAKATAALWAIINWDYQQQQGGEAHIGYGDVDTSAVIAAVKGLEV